MPRGDGGERPRVGPARSLLRRRRQERPRPRRAQAAPPIVAPRHRNWRLAERSVSGPGCTPFESEIRARRDVVYRQMQGCPQFLPLDLVATCSPVAPNQVPKLPREEKATEPADGAIITAKEDLTNDDVPVVHPRPSQLGGVVALQQPTYRRRRFGGGQDQRLRRPSSRRRATGDGLPLRRRQRERARCTRLFGDLAAASRAQGLGPRQAPLCAAKTAECDGMGIFHWLFPIAVVRWPKRAT